LIFSRARQGETDANAPASISPAERRTFVLASLARFVSPIALLLVHACAITNTYSAKPITATVVDAETGEPLQGVNVVAHWMLEEKRSGIVVGDLDLMESVTDKAGTFRFPAWRGKAPPTGKEPLTDQLFVHYETRLSSFSPEIIFFKSGYRRASRANQGYLSPAVRDQYHTWERSSEWDNKVIKLEKFKEDSQAYAELAGRTLSGLHFQNCAWTKMPNMLMSLFKEGDRLKALGIRENFPRYADFTERTDYKSCGSTEKIFADYLKK
jgi:hypothetical protein